MSPLNKHVARGEGHLGNEWWDCVGGTFLYVTTLHLHFMAKERGSEQVKGFLAQSHNSASPPLSFLSILVVRMQPPGLTGEVGMQLCFADRTAVST